MSRRTINTGGYQFEDAGDGQGVWTPAMREAERQRRQDADATAAANALASTNAKIAAIRADGTKTAQQKLIALRQLSASGYSREEFYVLWDAQANG